MTKIDLWFLAARILLLATRRVMVNALDSGPRLSGFESRLGRVYYVCLMQDN